MNTIGSLALGDWLSFVAGLLLSLGPGYGLASLCIDRYSPDSTRVLGLSVGLSLAFWPILLAWLHAFGIALSPGWVYALATLGGLVGAARRRPWLIPRGTQREGPWSTVALWTVLAATAAGGLYAVRGISVGPGSDSYHHSLIAHMIAERGMLPDSYQPFAPLTTFTYHFGFHALVAVFNWLTGIETVTLVPMVGQLLNAGAALSVAFFTLEATGRHQSATLSAAFAGLVSVFPAFFINWGRFTQLAGLVTLPVFLGLLWRWLRSNQGWSGVPFIGVLAAGVALVHYRVTLMAAVAGLVFAGYEGSTKNVWRETWKRVLSRLMLAMVIAGLLLAPWVWHVFGALRGGYANEVERPERTYFQLERLGADVLRYPTNAAFLGLTAAAVLLGWWRGAAPVQALSVWGAAAVLLSAQPLGGIFLDTVSVVISLYFPASVAIGWLADAVITTVVPQWKPLQWTVGLALLILVVQGTVNVSRIVKPGAVYVGPDDLSAMAWIRSNTSGSAYFMVNTFNWDFAPTYVIGSDGGYWLPLLTNRRTVTLPMTYPLERSSEPERADRLAALHQLDGHLTSQEALALLRDEDVTHVYVGQRGGPIVVGELLESPAFDLRYRSGAAYVFSLNGRP